MTSQEKVTYSSSNKKIVTVNSKGVITGKKREQPISQ
ncbi:Ig-like domain-containing protein [Ruminococcus sp. SR1/5]